MIPIDKERCQAEKPNKNNAFTLGGFPTGKMKRCENKPTIIATEKKEGSDGLKGSMTMCDDCLNVASKQLGNHFFDTAKI